MLERSVGSKLKMIQGLSGTSALTRWEESFIESCWAHSFQATKTSSLSDKQVETIDNIWRKHFS
jgi:hypothetical protein